MNTVIDLGSEVLVDRSEMFDPYVRLLAAALGETLAEGSPWVALDKQSAALCGLSPAYVRRARGTTSRSRRPLFTGNAG